MASTLFPGAGTPKALSAYFGYPVPARFVDLIRTVSKIVGARKAEDFFERAFGIRPEGIEARYPSTPPEFFPIGGTGGDGEHYGYVIHAPELKPADAPLGLFVPGEWNGVQFIGDTTVEAVETLLSFHVAADDDATPRLRAQAAALAKKLDIAPSARKAGRLGQLIRKTEEWRRVQPGVPDGWRHVMTADGVGVLLPAPAFAKGPHKLNKRMPPVSWFLDRAERAVRVDQPGTALVWLKEGYYQWQSNGSPELVGLFKSLAAAYRGFGREIHARAVEAANFG